MSNKENNYLIDSVHNKFDHQSAQQKSHNQHNKL